VKIIALEESFWYEKLATEGSTVSHVRVKSEVAADWQRKLVDFTEYRLPDMDRNGVDMQVLSLTSPGIQVQPDPGIAVADARLANEFLADVIKEHPRRFAGLAAIPLQDPPEATAELRRAVGLGLSGALVNDHTLGHYLDEPQYASFWETLQELDVPLYIHPNAVSSDNWRVMEGYPALDTAMWGWAPRTGGHAMRLILGGVFDRYPNARVILGHMGEFLPFQLSRMDSRYQVLDLKHPLKKLPSRYFRTNIAITTTGVFSHAALIAAIQEVGVDNVMFSIDYPFESTERAVEFIRTAPLAPADQARVAHVNAERILRLSEGNP
jgi:2,3-dihydroxybenzoate decarboxylase